MREYSTGSHGDSEPPVQRKSSRTWIARRDVIVAISVNVVLLVENVFQVRLKIQLLIDLVLQCSIEACVTRQHYSVVDGCEHVGSVDDSEPGAEFIYESIIVP